MPKTGFLEKALEVIEFIYGLLIITSIFAFIFFDPTDWAIWKKPWLVENLTKQCLDYRPVILDVKSTHEAAYLAETLKDYSIDRKKIRQRMINYYINEDDRLWQILSPQEKERIIKYYFELSAWRNFIRNIVPFGSSMRDPDWSQFEEGDEGLIPNNHYLEKLMEEARQDYESPEELKKYYDRAYSYIESIAEEKIDFEKRINEEIEYNENMIATARNKLAKKTKEIERANLAKETWLSYSDEELKLKCGSLAESINQAIGLFDKIYENISWEKIDIL